MQKSVFPLCLFLSVPGRLLLPDLRTKVFSVFQCYRLKWWPDNNKKVIVNT